MVASLDLGLSFDGGDQSAGGKPDGFVIKQSVRRHEELVTPGVTLVGGAAIVTDFVDVAGKPEPVYLMFELIADQSRSFTLKIEGNKYQNKTKAMT